MHVLLAIGHGTTPTGVFDPGAMTADGRKSEQTEGALIVPPAANRLRAAGVTVTAQRVRDPNFAGRTGYTQLANRLGVDLAVSVHHDWRGAPRGAFGHWAGGAGTAAERQRRQTVNKRAADAIYNAVQDAGFPMRPAWHKPRTDLTFTTATRVPAVLWECDRIGEVTDHDRYGRALADGILDFLGVAVPGRTITVGDRGPDVAEWNATLRRLFPHHPAASNRGDRFDVGTVVLTNLVLRYAGLTAADPNRPRVGPATRDAAERLAREPWAGKRVRIRTAGLRYYRQPGWWPDQTPAGHGVAGRWFGAAIVRKLEVGAGWQYEVASRRIGGYLYVTASDHVEVA